MVVNYSVLSYSLFPYTFRTDNKRILKFGQKIF